MCGLAESRARAGTNGQTDKLMVWWIPPRKASSSSTDGGYLVSAFCLCSAQTRTADPNQTSCEWEYSGVLWCFGQESLLHRSQVGQVASVQRQVCACTSAPDCLNPASRMPPLISAKLVIKALGHCADAGKRQKRQQAINAMKVDVWRVGRFWFGGHSTPPAAAVHVQSGGLGI